MNALHRVEREREREQRERPDEGDDPIIVFGKDVTPRRRSVLALQVERDPSRSSLGTTRLSFRPGQAFCHPHLPWRRRRWL